MWCINKYGGGALLVCPIYRSVNNISLVQICQRSIESFDDRVNKGLLWCMYIVSLDAEVTDIAPDT